MQECKGARAKGRKGERAKGRKDERMQGTRDKGQGSEATMPPVIANGVKQSSRKRPTNMPILDCFVPHNDDKGQGSEATMPPVIAKAVK
ncbi:MAG: hypothetical protein LBL13_14105 [Bacteroidales bacterium]|nr:hypothetical protein [Bacteroidales bacterium]